VRVSHFASECVLPVCQCVAPVLLLQQQTHCGSGVGKVGGWVVSPQWFDRAGVDQLTQVGQGGAVAFPLLLAPTAAQLYPPPCNVPWGPKELLLSLR